MAKDDASLTALTEADCTGDNAEFLIVFEGMGCGSGEGTTITCDESEKVSVTYTGGHCCDKTITEKFCPGDETATCVRDAGCDCSDESCCNTLGGSWPKPDVAGLDICVPEGYNSTCTKYGCIACPPRQTPSCVDNEDDWEADCTCS